MAERADFQKPHLAYLKDLIWQGMGVRLRGPKSYELLARIMSQVLMIKNHVILIYFFFTSFKDEKTSFYRTIIYIFSMNLIYPVEWHHIVMSVLCRKPYDLESDSLPYLLLYKCTYLGITMAWRQSYVYGVRDQCTFQILTGCQVGIGPPWYRTGPPPYPKMSDVTYKRNIV